MMEIRRSERITDRDGRDELNRLYRELFDLRINDPRREAIEAKINSMKNTTANNTFDPDARI